MDDLNIGLFVLAPKFYNDYTKEIKTESWNMDYNMKRIEET